MLTELHGEPSGVHLDVNTTLDKEGKIVPVTNVNKHCAVTGDWIYRPTFS
jgi:hypothetical protein